MSTTAWTSATTVTPSNDTPLDFQALYVGGAGIVRMRTRRGTLSSWTVPAGGYVLCGGDRVMATGTTATLILALN